LTCVSAAAGQTYTATTTANAGGPVAGFTYTINQLNQQTTPHIPTSWGSSPPAAGATAWIVR
jgi:hypothetical protein